MKPIVLGEGKTNDLWEGILRSIEFGGCELSKSKIYISINSAGYGRTRLSLSKNGRFLGLVYLNGEIRMGIDLSRASIKMTRYRSEERRDLEKSIRECKYLLTKSIAPEGYYDLQITERLAPSVAFTMKRNNSTLMPFPRVIIGMISESNGDDRHRQYPETEYDEDDCEECEEPF